MPHNALIADLEEFLAIGALADQAVTELLEGFCVEARRQGLSISRAMIAWRLLNPIFMTQNITWDVTKDGVEIEKFRHGEGGTSQDFLQSPIRYVVDHDVALLRRKIADPNSPLDFPLLHSFKERGYTDYVLMLIKFGRPMAVDVPGAGILVSFCSDAPGGFNEMDLLALERLKFMLALATRSTIQRDMRDSLAQTYLGRAAGQKVLSGQIMRGEGQSIDAVIWYCDLRGSTAICERLGLEDYLPFLNDYFCATAGPIAAAGGDVLDFIGDAVLAIMPLEDDGIARMLSATKDVLEELEKFRKEQAGVLGDRTCLADIAGIAIDTGPVMYGNIGIPDRLTFSVIGPTVNKVARIERLTKALREPVLVTNPIASACGGWQSCGMFELEGVGAAQELFAWTGVAERGVAHEPVKGLAGSHS
ncbi:MAG: adenylate/guanylate cyclase domain-containing protein [Pseudomonadota bacterium]